MTRKASCCRSSRDATRAGVARDEGRPAEEKTVWGRAGDPKVAGPVHKTPKRQAGLTELRGTVVFNHGETDMGDKGSKDKGKREQRKKAQLSLKEKRKLKKEKKNK